MRINWQTKKHWWFIDCSVWWKQCMFGFWWDAEWGVFELNLKIIFLDIIIAAHPKPSKRK